MNRAPSAGFLSRFARDTRGVSAIEFAFIAPVLILMYVGFVEISQAYMAQKRQAHVASVVADFVAQPATIDTKTLDDVLTVGAFLMKPFSDADLTVRVTSVTRDKNGAYKVDWSRGSHVSARKTDATITEGAILANLTKMGLVNGQTVIMSETSYKYTSPINVVKSIPFSGVYFLLPRLGTVVCTDCR